MKILEIIPVVPLSLPNCQAYRDTVYANDSVEHNRCARKASVTVNGVHLCRQHAGKIALNYLIEQGEKQDA